MMGFINKIRGVGVFYCIATASISVPKQLNQEVSIHAFPDLLHELICLKFNFLSLENVPFNLFK